VTAYGDAVNSAAKNSGADNALWLAPGLRQHVDWPENANTVAPGRQRIIDVLLK